MPRASTIARGSPPSLQTMSQRSFAILPEIVLAEIICTMALFGFVEDEREQIGIGEVAIVMRLFLRAHRPRLAGAGVEQARFLFDRATAFDDVGLAARFVFHSLRDEAHGVDVLDLAARAEMLELS